MPAENGDRESHERSCRSVVLRFLRPDLRKETYISICIFIILAGIATGVFIKQFHFNPAVLTAKQLMPEGMEVPDPLLDKDVIKLIPIPEGMVSMTAPESFNPDTLYEKINGKAELYLAAGFKRLLCHRLKADKSSQPDLWMEVYVYQMDSSTNAFAVYSRQRRNDGIALDLTEFSYKTKNAVFFTHGKYYVEVVGSAAEEKLFLFMYDFAGRFVKNVAVKSKKKKEFELFPKEGFVPKSISLIPSNAFGYEKLSNVYIATYKKNGKQAMLFLSNRNTSKSADDLSNGYKAFLEMFGGNILPLDIGVENARLIEIFGTYELFFTKGEYFCGVHESEDITLAKEMAITLFQSIQTKTDGKTKPAK
jgi:Family of unknown function (DUF6599)